MKGNLFVSFAYEQHDGKQGFHNAMLDNEWVKVGAIGVMDDIETIAERIKEITGYKTVVVLFFCRAER